MAQENSDHADFLNPFHFQLKVHSSLSQLANPSMPTKFHDPWLAINRLDGQDLEVRDQQKCLLSHEKTVPLDIQCFQRVWSQNPSPTTPHTIDWHPFVTRWTQHQPTPEALHSTTGAFAFFACFLLVLCLFRLSPLASSFFCSVFSVGCGLFFKTSELLSREPYTIFRTKKPATSPLSRFRSTDFWSRPLESLVSWPSSSSKALSASSMSLKEIHVE